ncbi:MAG TPA: hypothetical protein VLL52_19770 [Anaerolineae bacterium]|nr:hypothetical protein [Anaerolineae bacterium]
MPLLTKPITYFATSWRRLGLLFLLQLTSLNLLFYLENRFTTLTNHPVFDTQNTLTPTNLLTQISLCEGEAKTAYYLFALNNVYFPLLTPTLFDWLENIHFLLLINQTPPIPNLLVHGAILSKKLKLLTLNLTTLTLGLILLTTTAHYLYKKTTPLNNDT